MKAAWISLAALLACAPLSARGQSIAVPNYSFELPATGYVSTNVNSWQKVPKPSWYQESSGFTWDQLIGIFLNTAPGQSDSIDNLAGNQAAYLFAVPQVGMFQDYNSIDWQTTTPTHAFNATYTVGKAYTLTVGINGGGGGMLDGATLALILYYRDAGGNMVTVASTTVVQSAAVFPTHTHMTDFTVTVPTVRATDPWAGKNIGIQLVSTVSTALQGGYWDLDNVRLSASTSNSTSIPTTLAVSGSNLTVSWPTVTGNTYQLLYTPDFQTWFIDGPPAAGTGSPMSVQYPLSGQSQLFFKVQVTQPAGSGSSLSLSNALVTSSATVAPAKATPAKFTPVKPTPKPAAASNHLQSSKLPASALQIKQR